MMCIVTFKRGGDKYLAKKDDNGYLFLSAIRVTNPLIIKHPFVMPVYETIKDMESCIRNVRYFNTEQDAIECAALEAL